jgi:hypothetical protein
MDIGVEISLYPLTADYIPPIQNFIDRLNAHDGIRVITNSMSTQVFGPLGKVFEVLQREVGGTFEDREHAAGKAVFVMKVLGPLASV